MHTYAVYIYILLCLNHMQTYICTCTHHTCLPLIFSPSLSLIHTCTHNYSTESDPHTHQTTVLDSYTHAHTHYVTRFIHIHYTLCLIHMSTYTHTHMCIILLFDSYTQLTHVCIILLCIICTNFILLCI